MKDNTITISKDMLFIQTIIALCTFAIIIVFAIHIGEITTTDKIHKQAVSKGFGEYITDSDGDIKFQWKEIKK